MFGSLDVEWGDFPVSSVDFGISEDLGISVDLGLSEDLGTVGNLGISEDLGISDRRENSGHAGIKE
jgi:hypothetical protein